jgi:regulator of ribonuclease activity A
VVGSFGIKSNSPMTADLCDRYFTSPDRLNILEPNLLQSYGLKTSFHGKIETVSCFESNPLVRETLESPGMGRVLVVDAGSSKRCAVLGDKLAALAIQNNWAGVVINGYIRDSKIINGMDIGIKAIGTHPCKSSKSYRGVRGCSCNFGGVEFVPGYWLYSDEDGVIVSKNELILPNESGAEED